MQKAGEGMLQDEMWLGCIGEHTGLQRATVAHLWSGLVALLDANLTNGRAVDLGRFGILSLDLDKEYLARTSNGEVYLVPPHLSLSLGHKATEGKVTICLEELSQALCETTKLPLSTVQPFLRAIVPLSEENLSSDKPVLWSEVGTWTVDISEGIITYELAVAQTFRDNLNRPFGMFAPTLASDELVEKSNLQIINIDSIDDLGGELYLKLRLNETEEEEVGVLSKDPETREEERVEQPKTEETIMFSDDSKEEDLELLEDIEDEKQELSDSEQAEEAKIFLVETANHRVKHRIYWIILFVLLLFCLGLLWFLSQGVEREEIRRGPIPQIEEGRARELAKVDSISTLSIEQAIVDEAHVAPSRQASVDRDKDAPSLGHREDNSPRGVKRVEKPADRLEIVVLGEGESLQTLARRKYGDPIFWVYIYEENREFIRNPDEVPLGIQLRLPPARQYQINAYDNKSRQRALVLQRSYQTYREFGN